MTWIKLYAGFHPGGEGGTGGSKPPPPPPHSRSMGYGGDIPPTNFY